MRDLNEIREDINAVDTEIRALFLRRMALAREVAQTKAQTNDKILKPVRESEIIEAHSAGMDDSLRLKYISLLQSIMRTSRAYQYSEILRLRPDKFPLHPLTQAFAPVHVCYQGVQGAYQELAARAMFPACEPTCVETFAQVFQAVHAGKCDAGVVPVENTTAGAVSEVYDLLSKYDLSINRSCTKAIIHCLAAVDGATLDTVRRVRSHPHALPQCSDFIAAHGFEKIEMTNTAIAARYVSERADVTQAAICSREAAERYGLCVLAEGVNDHGCNETRFIAVSRELTLQPNDNRIEIMFHLHNVAGALCAVLSLFADYGVDMTEIHSRPMKDSPWSYVFYLDFTGNMHDAAIQSLLYQLSQELPFLRVLGSYCVTDSTEV